MESENEKTVKEDQELGVIFDCGSGMTKVGFCGHDAPRAVFPTIVEIPRRSMIMVGMDIVECYVGDEAQAKRGILRLGYPIEFGIIQRFKCAENLWKHIFNRELRVESSETPTMIIEPPDNPDCQREKICEVMFEKFDVPKFFLGDHSTLSLMANGNTSGTVLDSGESTTFVACIDDCRTVSLSRLNLGGRDVTEFLIKLLGERGYDMTSDCEREIVRDVKERMCRVHPCAYSKEDMDLKPIKEKLYYLPDESTIHLGSEIVHAPEIMFCPCSILPNFGELRNQTRRSRDEDLSEIPKGERVGIENLIRQTIKKAGSSDFESSSFSTLYLSGGNTLFPGFQQRLKESLLKVKKKKKKKLVSEIVCPEERRYSGWIGGSIMGSLSSFQNVWLSKKVYKEHGKQIMTKQKRRYSMAFGSLERKNKESVQDLKNRVEFIVMGLFEKKLLGNLTYVVVRERVKLGPFPKYFFE